MVGYEELVILETEFWELCEYMSERRPLEVPPLLSLEEWSKSRKRRAIPIWKKLMMGFGCMMLFSIPLNIACPIMGWDAEVTVIISLLLSILVTTIYCKIHTAALLRDSNSQVNRQLRKKYEEYEMDHRQRLNAPKMYDYSHQRIPVIFIYNGSQKNGGRPKYNY